MRVDILSRHAGRSVAALQHFPVWQGTSAATNHSIYAERLPGWRYATGSASREGTLIEDDPAAPFDPNTVPEEGAPERQGGGSPSKGHSSPDIDEVQKREGVGGFGGGYSGPQSAPGDDASPREGKNHRAGTQAPEGNVHPNLPERGSAGPSGRSDDPHASFDTGLQHNDRTANDPGPLTGAP